MKKFDTPEIHRYPLIIKDQVTGLNDNPLIHASNDNELPEDDF